MQKKENAYNQMTGVFPRGNTRDRKSRLVLTLTLCPFLHGVFGQLTIPGGNAFNLTHQPKAIETQVWQTGYVHQNLKKLC